MLVDSMVSVIIRNRNEQEYIGFAIQSVLDHIPNSQIIIADNTSNDASIDIVKLFDGDISIINIDNYTPGIAINSAIELCKYDTILILSAHAQLVKYDSTLVKTLLQNNAAVFGKQTPIYKGKKITRTDIWTHFIDTECVNMFSKIEDRPFLHNAFCFYNKQDLLNTPIDETLPGKEDRYWAFDILGKQQQYMYTPQLEVNHFYTNNGATWKII
jgi:glycosyltransferase involved in cell wall biosynthesis